MRKLENVETRMARISLHAHTKIKKVKLITGMGTREQIDELIALRDFCLENPNKGIGIGTLKASSNNWNRKEKKKKTHYGHMHDFNDEGICRSCAKTLAEVENE